MVTITHSTWWDGAVQARDGTPPAVFVEPVGECGWLDEIDAAVVSGRLNIARTVLPDAAPDEVMDWARSVGGDLPERVLRPLLDELRELCRIVCGIGNITRLTVRALTEVPTRRCGFHVDTVPPQVPTIGALRVYNGARTEYVEPDDVIDMSSFYAYLSRRERLSRATGIGSEPGTEVGHPNALATLDEAPGFLLPGALVRKVPARAAVFFRHIDVTRHWSPHRVREAWIHRSPMVDTGTPRFVVNLSPAERPRGLPRRERVGHG